MAWLERDRSKGPFQIVIRYGNQRIKRSTRTKRKREAEEIALRVDRRIWLIEQGDLAIPDGVDILTFLMSDGMPNQVSRKPKHITLQTAFEEYLAAIPNGAIEQNSLDTMCIHMRHLYAVLGKQCSLRTISHESLQDYIKARSQLPGRRGQSISACTIKKELTSFSSLWSFALRRGYVESVFPNRGLRFPKTTQKPRFQTWEEIERRIARSNFSKSDQEELWDCLYLTLSQIREVTRFVKSKARHQFLHPMLLTAAYTGARKSELIRAEIDDFDLDCRVLTIREKKRSRQRRTHRTVPIASSICDELAEWFRSHPGGKHAFRLKKASGGSACESDDESLTVNQVHYHLKKTLTGKWSKICGWHVFRHSFASNCAAKGIDQRIINSWMGHQTEAMVLRYRHLLPDVQQEAMSVVFESA